MEGHRLTPAPKMREIRFECRATAGYPNFSLHSLRHSHASILLGNGTPLAVVSERLGHAYQDIALSLYSHSLPADRKAASRLWHTALAEVISEDRLRKSVQNLAPPRKLAVNVGDVQPSSFNNFSGNPPLAL